MPTAQKIAIPSIRRPILEALAAAPDDVFGHAIERLAGLDSHLNDVIRGFSADSSEAATKITSAVQDHQDAVAAAAEEAKTPPPAPAPRASRAKPAKKAATKSRARRR